MTSVFSAAALTQKLVENRLPPGLRRFLLPLQKLQECLEQSAKAANVTGTFYEMPSRQYLFYLEALARIYRRIHNNKRFERMRAAFKGLEDQLGRIDFFDGWINEFSPQENFPSVILENFQQHKNDEMQGLLSLLKKQEWITRDAAMMSNILSGLEDADWLKPEDDRNEIGETISKELMKFETDYNDGILDFHDIEHGLHEFRRDIRWFSIYAQALDGLIQLKAIPIPDPKLKPYLTDDIIHSPYNQLPPLKGNIEPILIEAPNFYALSWLINEMGIMKDDGLRIEALGQAAVESKLYDETDAQTRVAALAVKNKYQLAEIPSKAQVIADQMLYDNSLLKRIRRDIKR